MVEGALCTSAPVADSQPTVLASMGPGKGLTGVLALASERSASASGAWLTTGTTDLVSIVQSCASRSLSLVSKEITMLHHYRGITKHEVHRVGESLRDRGRSHDQSS